MMEKCTLDGRPLRQRSHGAVRLVGRTLLLLGTLAVAANPAAAESEFSAAVGADYRDHLAAIFDHFHRNPELSFQEQATAARLALELRALGIEVTERVGGTGLVGVIRNGPGPVVLVRADMDALPLLEASGLANRSTRRQTRADGVEVPVMHACGHDVHMTSLVGTARQLIRLRDRWSGTVVLVGQPAEERSGGARAMIEDGLYSRFPKPDIALAFHVAADFPTGMLDVQPGLVASSSDSLEILVHGTGAHGAYPHEGRDPVVMGSQIVMALQTLVSREISPIAPAVVTVGSFQSGSAPNIIPEEARLQLTVRANDRAVRQTLLDGIRRIAHNVGRMNGMPENRLPEVREVDNSSPSVVNDPELSARLREAMTQAFGASAMLPIVPPSGMGAEDFAYFVEPQHGVKGVYFYVGGTPPAAFEAARTGGPPVPSHHSPNFRIDPEPSVRLGTEAMLVALLDLLGPGGQERQSKSSTPGG